MSFKIESLYHFPITIPNASSTQDGVMSKADKIKLDSLSPGGGPPPYDNDPESLGVANPGNAIEYARGNHVHAHGAQGGDNEHALATQSVAGFMSSADKTKLNGLTKDFLNQYFEGSFNAVPNALTEIFRFTPNLGGLMQANLTVEYDIFSTAGGCSTLNQTIIYKVLGGTVFLSQAGVATTLGDGIVNSTVTLVGNTIVISMTGSTEDTINVLVVAKCRVSNG
jgi:hypothetical protein